MTTIDLPRFDALYSVSDLHLGGAPGQQVFDQGELLAATIRKLAEARDGPVAFVINGDFVDFLADPKAEYFAGENAVARLSAVVNDRAFSPVFEALRAFLENERCHLVIVLGNHDVELALPNVQLWLSSWLADGKSSRLGRILWATSGAGFSCEVGGKRVLCLHGNEFDDWNVVDHFALLQYVRAANRGLPPPAWSPNGGTRLVVDVMNEVKRTYPMVDLLKPETKAAVPMVLALSPSYLKRAGAALSAISAKFRDSLRAAAGFLGEASGPDQQPPSEAEALREVLGPLSEPQASAGRGLPNEILEAQRRLELKTARPTAFDPDDDLALLGLSESWEKRRVPTMRAALQRWLAGDQTFSIANKDELFKAVDAAVGSAVHFVVVGHSHLRRALPRSVRGSYYLNTGTWIRLIQIDASWLRDDASFEPVFKLLGSPRLEDLDNAKLDGKPLVRREPTVAAIRSTASGATASLCEAQPDGSLRTLENSSFTS